MTLRSLDDVDGRVPLLKRSVSVLRRAGGLAVQAGQPSRGPVRRLLLAGLGGDGLDLLDVAVTTSILFATAWIAWVATAPVIARTAAPVALARRAAASAVSREESRCGGLRSNLGLKMGPTAVPRAAVFASLDAAGEDGLVSLGKLAKLS